MEIDHPFHIDGRGRTASPETHTKPFPVGV